MKYERVCSKNIKSTERQQYCWPAQIWRKCKKIGMLVTTSLLMVLACHFLWNRTKQFFPLLKHRNSLHFVHLKPDTPFWHRAQRSPDLCWGWLLLALLSSGNWPVTCVVVPTVICWLGMFSYCIAVLKTMQRRSSYRTHSVHLESEF